MPAAPGQTVETGVLPAGQSPTEGVTAPKREGRISRFRRRHKEMRERELLDQSLYLSAKYAEERDARMGLLNPIKIVTAPLEALVVGRLRARRLRKSMVLYRETHDGQMPITTEGYIREATRIWRRGQHREQATTESEASALALRTLARGETPQSAAREAASDTYARETALQAGPFASAVYRDVIQPILESPPPKTDEEREAQRAKIRDQIDMIIRTNPDDPAVQGLRDYGRNFEQICRGIYSLANELRNVGIRNASDNQRIDEVFQSLQDGVDATGMSGLFGQYNRRAALTVAQYAKNAALVAAGISMAANPLVAAAVGGVTMILIHRGKLGFERRMRTIDKARGVLKPTPADQGTLRRIFSVDWNQTNSKGQLGRTGDLWAAAAGRGFIGMFTSLGWFGLGEYTPIGEVVGHVARGAGETVGNGLGKAGEGIGHVLGRTGEIAGSTGPGRAAEDLLGNVGHTAGNGLGEIGDAKDALLRLAGLEHTQAHCFVAGTMILMADGSSKRIEDVKVGEMVLSYDEETQEIVAKEVLEVVSPIHTALVTIHFANGVENTNTIDHPYLTVEKGWVSYDPEATEKKYGLQVEKLATQDKVYSYVDGKLEEVIVEQLTVSHGETQTYNLSNIADTHTFFANGILVHNKSTLGTGRVTETTAHVSTPGDTVGSDHADKVVVMPRSVEAPPPPAASTPPIETSHTASVDSLFGHHNPNVTETHTYAGNMNGAEHFHQPTGNGLTAHPEDASDKALGTWQGAHTAFNPDGKSVEFYGTYPGAKEFIQINGHYYTFDPQAMHLGGTHDVGLTALDGSGHVPMTEDQFLHMIGYGDKNSILAGNIVNQTYSHWAALHHIIGTHDASDRLAQALDPQWLAKHPGFGDMLRSNLHGHGLSPADIHSPSVPMGEAIPNGPHGITILAQNQHVDAAHLPKTITIGKPVSGTTGSTGGATPGGNPGGDEFQTGVGRFFDEHIGSDDLARLADQATLFAMKNPRAAIAAALLGVGGHVALNRSVGVFNRDGNRVSGIAHVGTLGMFTAATVLGAVNPGFAVITGATYIAPYIPRFVAAGVRAVTGRGGNNAQGGHGGGNGGNGGGGNGGNPQNQNQQNAQGGNQGNNQQANQAQTPQTAGTSSTQPLYQRPAGLNAGNISALQTVPANPPAKGRGANRAQEAAQKAEQNLGNGIRAEQVQRARTIGAAASASGGNDMGQVAHAAVEGMETIANSQDAPVQAQALDLSIRRNAEILAASTGVSADEVALLADQIQWTHAARQAIRSYREGLHGATPNPQDMANGALQAMETADVIPNKKGTSDATVALRQARILDREITAQLGASYRTEIQDAFAPGSYTAESRAAVAAFLYQPSGAGIDAQERIEAAFDEAGVFKGTVDNAGVASVARALNEAFQGDDMNMLGQNNQRRDNIISVVEGHTGTSRALTARVIATLTPGGKQAQVDAAVTYWRNKTNSDQKEAAAIADQLEDMGIGRSLIDAKFKGAKPATGVDAAVDEAKSNKSSSNVDKIRAGMDRIPASGTPPKRKPEDVGTALARMSRDIPGITAADIQQYVESLPNVTPTERVEIATAALKALTENGTKPADRKVMEVVLAAAGLKRLPDGTTLPVDDPTLETIARLGLAIHEYNTHGKNNGPVGAGCEIKDPANEFNEILNLADNRTNLAEAVLRLTTSDLAEVRLEHVLHIAISDAAPVEKINEVLEAVQKSPSWKGATIDKSKLHTLVSGIDDTEKQAVIFGRFVDPGSDGVAKVTVDTLLTGSKEPKAVVGVVLGLRRIKQPNDKLVKAMEGLSLDPSVDRLDLMREAQRRSTGSSEQDQAEVMVMAARATIDRENFDDVNAVFEFLRGAVGKDKLSVISDAINLLEIPLQRRIEFVEKYLRDNGLSQIGDYDESEKNNKKKQENKDKVEKDVDREVRLALAMVGSLDVSTLGVQRGKVLDMIRDILKDKVTAKDLSNVISDVWRGIITTQSPQQTP